MGVECKNKNRKQQKRARLAQLHRHARVLEVQQRVAEGAVGLAGDGRDGWRQAEGLQRAGPRPGCEPPPLPVVAVVRQRGLGAQQQHAAVQAERAAVVAHAPVGGGQPHVRQQAPRGRATQQPGQRLPAVRLCVSLQEVVLAAVAAELQLRPHPQRRPRRPRGRARRLRARQVAVEVKGPLVERAGGERDAALQRGRRHHPADRPTDGAVPPRMRSPDTAPQPAAAWARRGYGQIDEPPTSKLLDGSLGSKAAKQRGQLGGRRDGRASLQHAGGLKTKCDRNLCGTTTPPLYAARGGIRH